MAAGAALGGTGVLLAGTAGAERLPGYHALWNGLCPSSWTFYTPHESRVVNCIVPPFLVEWLGPLLGCIEGAIIFGTIHLARELLTRRR